jgi:hypothetical protein
VRGRVGGLEGCQPAEPQRAALGAVSWGVQNCSNLVETAPQVRHDLGDTRGAAGRRAALRTLTAASCVLNAAGHKDRLLFGGAHAAGRARARPGRVGRPLFAADCCGVRGRLAGHAWAAGVCRRPPDLAFCAPACLGPVKRM